MKREFLLNFKVGDQPLPKEVIDAIMAENGRDIEAAKKPFGDYDTLKTQLETAQKTIQGFKDQDIEGTRQSARDWEEKYNQAVKDHEAKLADMAFDQILDGTITTAKGRNAKAIKALLDVDTLKGSKNQEADIKAALEGLQKESGYLFGSDEVPPPYAAGTGACALFQYLQLEKRLQSGYNHVVFARQICIRRSARCSSLIATPTADLIAALFGRSSASCAASAADQFAVP